MKENENKHERKGENRKGKDEKEREIRKIT